MSPTLAALRLCEFFVMAGMKFSFFVIYCVNILLQALFFFCRQSDKRHETKYMDSCTVHMMTLELCFNTYFHDLNARSINRWQLNDCNLFAHRRLLKVFGANQHRMSSLDDSLVFRLIWIRIIAAASCPEKFQCPEEVRLNNIALYHVHGVKADRSKVIKERKKNVICQNQKSHSCWCIIIISSAITTSAGFATLSVALLDTTSPQFCNKNRA